MFKKIYFIIAFVSSILLFSCTEDNFDEFTPDDTNTPDTTSNYDFDNPDGLENLFTELQDEIYEAVTDSFLIIGLGGANCTTPSGGFCTFPTSCCGNSIDTFLVKITELINKQHFIKFRKPTVTNNQEPLVSGGSLKISIFKDGQPYELGENDSINFSIPKISSEYESEMKLFNGVNIENPFISADEIFAWELINPNAEDSIATVPIVVDQETDSIYYNFFVNNLGWINVDAFYGLPDDQLSDLTVQLPENYTYRNTSVFVYFKEENSVLNCLNSEEAKYIAQNMPNGKEVEIFSITVLKKQDNSFDYFLGTSGLFTIEEDVTKNITPALVTKADIMTYINGL